MNVPHQNDVSHVGGSWWTASAGWLVSAWSSVTSGMPPLAAAVAFATLVLTVVKIAQEVRAWRRADDERTLVRKLLDKLGRKSGFDKLDSRT